MTTHRDLKPADTFLAQLRDLCREHGYHRIDVTVNCDGRVSFEALDTRGCVMAGRDADLDRKSDRLMPSKALADLIHAVGGTVDADEVRP